MMCRAKRKITADWHFLQQFYFAKHFRLIVQSGRVQVWSQRALNFQLLKKEQCVCACVICILWGINHKFNRSAAISTTVQNLLFCSHTLCMSYVINTFLLVRSLVRSKKVLCFVHGEDQKSEQKPTTKNFVGFLNHFPLLTMVTCRNNRGSDGILLLGSIRYKTKFVWTIYSQEITRRDSLS